MAGIGDYLKGGVEVVKKNPVEMIVGGIVAGLVAGFSVGFCASMVTSGYYAMVLKSRRGEPITIGDVFSRMNLDSFVIGLPMIAVSIVRVIVMLLVAFVLHSMLLLQLTNLVFLLITLAVLLAFAWAAPMQGVKQTPFMDAFKGSLAFWQKDPVGVFLIMLAAGGIAVAGCFVCVGWIVTIPIAQAMTMVAYLDKTGTLPYVPAPDAPAAPAPVAS